MNKYKNNKCEYNGIKFDSEAEMRFYVDMLEKHSAQDIKIQPIFILQDKFKCNRGGNTKSYNLCG